MAKPKEVLAIMGASGAGKTTLLNVLNFRNRGQLKIEGEIMLNGCSIKSVGQLSSISGYVQQDDLFVGYLTVKEHLIFQAMLRMDKSVSRKERLHRVFEVIHEVRFHLSNLNLFQLLFIS
jgi:ABC-type multidrug transport system ATPase subunit